MFVDFSNSIIDEIRIKLPINVHKTSHRTSCM